MKAEDLNTVRTAMLAAFSDALDDNDCFNGMIDIVENEAQKNLDNDGARKCSRTFAAKVRIEKQEDGTYAIGIRMIAQTREAIEGNGSQTVNLLQPELL